MKLPIHTTALPTDLSGIKVTLVNVPVREQSVPNNAPLGPGLLAARLEQHGAEVRILDLNARRPVWTTMQARSVLANHVRRYGSQDMWGLSGLITTLAWQQYVARCIYAVDPAAVIASGGGLATQFRSQLFEWIPELDVVAHSEGDDVILQMAWDAKHKRADVLGSKRVYDGGRPADLDALPFPAWHLHPDIEEYIRAPIWGLSAGNSSATPFTMTRSLNTVSSRGCPFACKFCFRGAQGERNYGVRSAASLAAEMRWLMEQYGCDFVGITDDNFMVQPKRLSELPGALPSIAWGTHGRLDEAADRLRVEHMAGAGCVYIGFGAESASPSTLLAMGKGGHMLSRGTVKIGGYDVPKTMVDGIRNTHEAGIHGNCTWIRGWPGETLEDLKHTVAFILWQEQLTGQACNRNLFVATAYPGTELWKDESVQGVLRERFQVHTSEGLMSYVLELNDATKVLVDDDGQPLNFSAMDDATFARVTECVEAGELERIMEL